MLRPEKFVCYPCNKWAESNPVCFADACIQYKNAIKNWRRGLADFPYLVDEYGMRSDVFYFEPTHEEGYDYAISMLDLHDRLFVEVDGTIYVQTFDEEDEDYITVLVSKDC